MGERQVLVAQQIQKQNPRATLAGPPPLARATTNGRTGPEGLFSGTKHLPAGAANGADAELSLAGIFNKNPVQVNARYTAETPKDLWPGARRYTARSGGHRLPDPAAALPPIHVAQPVPQQLMEDNEHSAFAPKNPAPIPPRRTLPSTVSKTPSKSISIPISNVTLSIDDWWVCRGTLPPFEATTEEKTVLYAANSSGNLMVGQVDGTAEASKLGLIVDSDKIGNELPFSSLLAAKCCEAGSLASGKPHAPFLFVQGAQGLQAQKTFSTGVVGAPFRVESDWFVFRFARESNGKYPKVIPDLQKMFFGRAPLAVLGYECRLCFLPNSSLLGSLLAFTLLEASQMRTRFPDLFVIHPCLYPERFARLQRNPHPHGRALRLLAQPQRLRRQSAIQRSRRGYLLHRFLRLTIPNRTSQFQGLQRDVRAKTRLVRTTTMTQNLLLS